MTRKLTKQEVKKRIIGDVRSGNATIETDNEGQLIIYTGLYEWSDGSVREDEEPYTPCIP